MKINRKRGIAVLVAGALLGGMAFARHHSHRDHSNRKNADDQQVTDNTTSDHRDFRFQYSSRSQSLSTHSRYRLVSKRDRREAGNQDRSTANSKPPGQDSLALQLKGCLGENGLAALQQKINDQLRQPSGGSSQVIGSSFRAAFAQATPGNSCYLANAYLQKALVRIPKMDIGIKRSLIEAQMNHADLQQLDPLNRNNFVIRSHQNLYAFGNRFNAYGKSTEKFFGREDISNGTKIFGLKNIQNAAK